MNRRDDRIVALVPLATGMDVRGVVTRIDRAVMGNCGNKAVMRIPQGKNIVPVYRRHHLGGATIHTLKPFQDHQQDRGA